MRWCALIEPPTLSGPVVRALTVALVAINLDYLQRNPGTPPLYHSGVRYQSEPVSGVGRDGRRLKIEKWASVPFVLARRVGDCEDLACWRAAELQLRGVAAYVDLRCVKTTSGGKLFHVFVRLPDGRVEDPSAHLGMPS